MSAQIHSTAIVDPAARLGHGVKIGAYAHVGAGVELGDECVLHPHAQIIGKTTIGPGCTFHSFSVIGGKAQVIGLSDDQVGSVMIGSGGEFREYATVHSGVKRNGGVTRIGANAYLMVNCHIAHDGTFGDNIVMATNACVAGLVDVGDHVWFGGASAVHQGARIGRNAFIGGGAILVDDVIPFGSVIGNRARLAGLNAVGLKRRGFSRGDIRTIHAAYKAMFTGDGVFADRVDAAAANCADQPLAMEMIDFVRGDHSRSICKP